MKKLIVCLIASIILGCAALSINISPSDLSLKDKAVMLVSNNSSCSGVQIVAPSGANYILTAAHCGSLADEDGNIEVIKETGESLWRKVLGEDSESDLLLLEGLPNHDGVKIGESDSRGTEVRTFTHGRAMPTYQTNGELIGDDTIVIPTFLVESQEQQDECLSKQKFVLVPSIMGAMVCLMVVKENATTALILPGSSGGMVVNSSGELVGIVSAAGGGLGFLVPLSDIKRFIAGY
jgi:hypothetical protein